MKIQHCKIIIIPQTSVPVNGDGCLLDTDLLLQSQADALQLPLPPLALLQLNSEGWGGRLYYIAATEAVNRTAKCLNAGFCICTNQTARQL